MMSDDDLKTALAASPAERVTEEYMASRIKKVDYYGPGTGTLTFCILTLDNGYAVTGESACVDPANYRADIGQKIAYDMAFRKLWPLFGFLLTEVRHQRAAA